MTKKQQAELGGLVRALAAAIGGCLVTFNTLTPDQSNALVAVAGAAVIAFTGIWSICAKRK